MRHLRGSFNHEDNEKMDYEIVCLPPIYLYDRIYHIECQADVVPAIFFLMGRIDPEKMYANIQKLDWRNINDGKIYLDEQTKRSSISMRNNLMRLSDAFAAQGDTVKACQSPISSSPLRSSSEYFEMFKNH